MNKKDHVEHNQNIPSNKDQNDLYRSLRVNLSDQKEPESYPAVTNIVI